MLGALLASVLLSAAQQAGAADWDVFGGGVSILPGPADNRRPIWKCVSASDTSCAGICREYHYMTPSLTPVIYRGTSRSEGVEKGEYCIYLDLFHTDGTATYGQKMTWPYDTEDWTERVGAYVPKKPVSRIKMHAFLRRGKGTVWFRDLALERREGRGETIYTFHRTRQPYSRVDTVAETIFTGTNFLSKSFTLPSIGELAVPLETNAVVVWTADSMRRVTPLTFPGSGDVPLKPIHLDLAHGECESAQMCVSVGKAIQLTDVSVEIGEFSDKDGKALNGKVTWQRIGYVPRMPGYHRRRHGGPPGYETWLPDPLLPPRAFKVRRASTQGVWLTVKIDRDRKCPGVYSGIVRVVAKEKCLAKVPVTIRVRNFALPEKFALPTAFSVMDGYTRSYYPHDAKRKIRQSHDIMLDHRLNPDDITRTEFPDIDNLKYARSRGMNRFTIVNLVPPPNDGSSKWTPTASEKVLFSPEFYEDLKSRLSPYVERLKRAGLLEMGCLYGFDERGKSYFDGIAMLKGKLSRDFPGLPLLTTAFSYYEMTKRPQSEVPESWMAPDWFCPLTSVYDAGLSDRLRKKGKQVWWYTCCSPDYPYANMAFLESPWFEGRLLLGWQTYLYRADGFLYWHVNWWNNQPLLDEGDTYFPSWSTRGYWNAHGDGVFLYPGVNGILPSIRLAMVRDGVEDYEWMKAVAEPRCSRKAVESHVRRIVTDMKKYSTSIEDIRKVRSAIGDLIESQR